MGKDNKKICIMNDWECTVLHVCTVGGAWGGPIHSHVSSPSRFVGVRCSKLRYRSFSKNSMLQFRYSIIVSFKS